MKAPSLTIDRKNKAITIVMALEAAHPSKATGKTMVIGSTKGLRTSAEKFARRPVCFTANVVYFPAKPANSGGGSADSNGTNDDLLRARGSEGKGSGSRNKFKKEEKS
jgi:hypothetical protein